MEKELSDSPVVRIAVHPNDFDRIALGCIDGRIAFSSFDVAQSKLEELCSKKLKRSVRDLVYSRDGSHLYSISENFALCVFDAVTSKRIRCIKKSHSDKPNVMALLPSSSTRGQQLSTADESGEVRTWDLRVGTPLIETFKKQEDVINGMAVCGNTLVCACSDGTLCAYEMRKRKLLMRSEVMHSELLSVAVTDRFTYVGSGDGHLEVFKNGEYGNILERIETGHRFGVDCVCALRPGLLLTASNEDAKLRLLHVNPNKRLGNIGVHGKGVQHLARSGDGKWIMSVGCVTPSVRWWNSADIVDKVPIIRSNELKKAKGDRKESNFFDDLCVAREERDDTEDSSDAEDSDEDSEDDEKSEGEDDGNAESDREGAEMHSEDGNGDDSSDSESETSGEDEGN